MVELLGWGLDPWPLQALLVKLVPVAPCPNTRPAVTLMVFIWARTHRAADGLSRANVPIAARNICAAFDPAKYSRIRLLPVSATNRSPEASSATALGLHSPVLPLAQTFAVKSSPVPPCPKTRFASGLTTG